MADYVFTGRTGAAVVTGAASGIGAATAIELARRGCSVALVDRVEDALAATAREVALIGVHVSTHAVDVTDATAVAGLPAQVAEAHGGAHVLVNCAGVSLLGTFEQLTLEEFEWLLDVNLWGTIAVTKAMMPLLRDQSSAHISNLSSGYGLIAPAGRVPYATSKFAIRGFTEALGRELEGTGITTSVVHPGGIKTQIALKARAAAAVPAEVAAKAAQAQTAKYRITPEDAATGIVNGIEQRRSRVLIGNDVRFLDLLSRVAPVRGWALLRRTMADATNTASDRAT